ncbi:hypothetical protein Krac_9605 [Ktedonobacter racemifer DSM 44963]|uniref:Uncharacterized protein n=1 Tax=Ktedonobacter racemifer DSM 44963 TaxID=485913 RepID=D6TCT1_KTERA|nr:hypothetical protein Krac_9605 [Ktedonobacter racemifer DSM 44963]
MACSINKQTDLQAKKVVEMMEGGALTWVLPRMVSLRYCMEATSSDRKLGVHRC